ncbi:NTE family protein [Pseudomonas linyingensis]|jgi:NTE family protein|uniref:NTE family protein n=1 Tax=Pseudomonas linyingensis TaxID=915471 RepID=A0A1H6WL13_9PSED|nr:patatin-like phospholipase family protein [Pseudomonas linyingensis]MCM2318833.1 patatin-like phospholipase family protein [Pseudomonas sp.]SEJ15884.1 NTE family protein [Pseudomonas linyingensis]
MDRQAGKTAFVLAGGGSLGAVQVGMLKALQSEGVVADLVVGSSVGAINAAYFAAAPDREGIARLERIWLELRRSDIFPFSPADTLLGLIGRRDYLMPPRQLQRLIASRLPYRQLEDAALPCHVVATDVLTGREVILSSGEALPALLASAAIPAVFPTVSIGGQALMDGGIASNTPISAAVTLGASRVLVLPTGTPCALKAPPHGALATALHAVNLLAMRQLLADVDRFASRCELIVLPPLCPLAVNTYDFSHSAELIERAELAARRWLQDGMQRLQGKDPHQLLEPHSH